MKKWMEVKNIGQLNYERIIVRFDIPLLFTCTDSAGNRYIVVCADDEKGVYVVGLTDIKSLLDMLKNRLTMYDYFRQRKNLFLISYDVSSREFVWRPVTQNEIMDDMLPDRGKYLELNNDNISDYIKELENIDLYMDWDRLSISEWTKYFVNQIDYYKLVNSVVDYISSQSIFDEMVWNTDKEATIQIESNEMTWELEAA